MPQFFPDLSLRNREPELMDAPDLERGAHLHALRGLSRINRLSLTVPRIWKRIRALPPSGAGPLRVLDLACGGGDVALGLKARAVKAGVDLHMAACDRSPIALDFGRDRAREAGLDVHFFQLDVIKEEIPGGFDLICSSLFLHHLSRQECVNLLIRMAGAGRSVLIQDLRRSWMGFLLAWVTVRGVTGSPVVRVDGPRSVRAAYSIPEIGSLVAEAGLQGARIDACWPQRFSIRWDGS